MHAIPLLGRITSCHAHPRPSSHVLLSTVVLLIIVRLLPLVCVTSRPWPCGTSSLRAGAWAATCWAPATWATASAPRSGPSSAGLQQHRAAHRIRATHSCTCQLTQFTASCCMRLELSQDGDGGALCHAGALTSQQSSCMQELQRHCRSRRGAHWCGRARCTPSSRCASTPAGGGGCGSCAARRPASSAPALQRKGLSPVSNIPASRYQAYKHVANKIHRGNPGGSGRFGGVRE